MNRPDLTLLHHVLWNPEWIDCSRAMEGSAAVINEVDNVGLFSSFFRYVIKYMYKWLISNLYIDLYIDLSIFRYKNDENPKTHSDPRRPSSYTQTNSLYLLSPFPQKRKEKKTIKIKNEKQTNQQTNKQINIILYQQYLSQIKSDLN